MGIFRLGFLANFLSHPVISGFISASGLLIAASQIGPLTGLKSEGHNLLAQRRSLAAQVTAINLSTLLIGGASLAFLFWVRRGLKPLLWRAGLPPRPADMLAKAGPVVAIAASTLAVWGLSRDGAGVAVVGAVPQSLPPFTLPSFDLALLH